MGDIEVTIWSAPPPRSTGPTSPRSARPNPSVGRACFAAGVIALHVVGIAALISRTSALHPVNAKLRYAPVATFLIEEVVPAPIVSDTSKTLLPKLEPRKVDVESPQLPEIDTEASAPDQSLPQFGQFIPPRPEYVNTSVLDFEREAALRAGEMARVILRVEVMPDGTTGTVAIDIGSGNSRADEAAVKYARSLRWVPASFGGEPTRMKIRLPVVFTGTG